MTAGLFGLIAALGWGGADFIARFTGRAIGHQQALFGVTAVGVVALSLLFWILELDMNWHASGLWLLIISGIGIMLSTMLLYQGLALGPVTIVAPIVGSFPVFNMALAVFLGARPGMLQWIAIASVLGGVWAVSYASDHFLEQGEYSRPQLRRVIIISIISSLGFGISIAASQAATHYYGELQTICLSRWIGLITLSLYFICKRITPRTVLRCWPLITIQGLLDTTAFVVLMLAAHTPAPEIAVVISSGFCIVTILLARVILKEIMSWPQWLGVVMIVAGVAVLSASQ
jgi:drug/metabolite transporter (DMT)-like permease